MKTKLAILFALFISHTSQSQLPVFVPQLNIAVTVSGNQLPNAWAGGINFPLWSEIDLNGDGIHDLFMYDRVNDRISTFINDGTAGAHPFHYAPQYVSNFPYTSYEHWILCADYNCDGKSDLFILDSLGDGIVVYRNDFDSLQGLHFTLVSPALTEDQGLLFIFNNPKIFATSIYVPAFIDVDNDGDLDILTFNEIPDGKIAWHKNHSMEDYGVCDSLDFYLETKCWGKFTLSFGANYVGSFHDSCSVQAPHNSHNFNNPDNSNYQIAKRDDTVSTLFAFDNDGNGLKDLLIGDISANTCLMVHNNGTLQDADMDAEDRAFPAYDTPVAMYQLNTHAYIDVDNDGAKDLLVSSGESENYQGVWYYKNTGTTASPHFSFQRTTFLQDEMIDLGEAASPVFFDENADGLPDLIAGNGISQAGAIPGGLSLYRNIGTLTAPAFELISNQYANVNTLSLYTPIFPAFGDMDGDGDKDMIIGTVDGKLYYFDNSAGAGNPANFTMTIPNYMGIDVGNGSTPQIIDLNRDGKPDLVIGEKSGILNYFENTGTLTSATFAALPDISPLGNIDLHSIGTVDGWAAPFIYNDSGQYKMIVSCMKGDVLYYNNIDGNLTGTFNQVGTILSRSQGIKVSYNLSVSGADINNDGVMDFVLGIYGGGMQIYYGDNGTLGIASPEINKPSLAIFPIPANNTLSIRAQNLSPSRNNILCIYNIVGEKIFEKQIVTGTLNIDTHEIPNGVYIIKLQSQHFTETKKLIITHQ